MELISWRRLPSSQSKPEIVACGGWSKRKTLYGGDQYAAREDSLLDPARDAAKIRAFFVHPEWARRGIGSLILEACENAALRSRLHPPGDGRDSERRGILQSKGYAAVENQQVPLGNGETLPIVRMAKESGVNEQMVSGDSRLGCPADHREASLLTLFSCFNLRPTISNFPPSTMLIASV